MDKAREKKLVEACQHGDRMAMGTLVRQYERPVYNAAFRMLGNADDAADVTQTAFLRAFERLNQFNPRFRFFSWIYRIAINEAIDQLHRRGRLEALDTEPASDIAPPDANASDDETHARLQHMLMMLPDDQRSVLVLRYFSGCDYQQMAAILEIPVKTVKSRLFTARQQLKNRLASSGLQTHD